jgi:VanZ family protein
LLKLIPFVSWGAFILLLTCVSDFTGLMNNQSIQFKWIENPPFSELLLLPNSLEHYYIIQKSGHLIAFLIFAFISPFSPRKTVQLGFIFAVLTEFLQLYLGRSGRLLDIGYDATGLFLGALFMMIRNQMKLKTKNIKAKLLEKGYQFK